MAVFIILAISFKLIQPQAIFTTPNYRGREVGFSIQLSTQEAMGRIRREAIPKAGSASKKLMLFIWWDVNGVIYWELLDSKSTLTAAVYSQQLDKVAEAVRTKRPEKTKIILQHQTSQS